MISGAFLYNQKLPTYKLAIEYSDLMPYVSHEQARENICSAIKGSLFEEICQNKFNQVGKNDSEKISTLLLLLEQSKNDSAITDYEKQLFSQVIFASLPTKDSELAQRSGFRNQIDILNNLFKSSYIAYAQEPNDPSENRKAFDEFMISDLSEVISNIPKGDNAWTVSIMVSKYEWVNGIRQPIYSEQYAEVFDPYPGISTEDKSGDEQQNLVHVNSRVGTYMSSGEMLSTINETSSGEMIAYAYSVNSWKSKPYASDSVLILAEAGPGAQYLNSEYHFTEDGYEGEQFMSNLLLMVDMPSQEVPKDNKLSDDDCDKYTPGDAILRSEAACVQSTEGCEVWVDDPIRGLYCFDNYDKFENLLGDDTSEDGIRLDIIDVLRTLAPTYPYSDAEEVNGAPANFPGNLY